MRRTIFLLVLFAAITVLSGCAQISRGRTEINKLFIVRVMSIDEAADGKVRITLTTKSLSMGGGGQQPEQKGESVVSEGDTVFDAVRNLVVYSDRKPSYGHTEYILFGEAIAKKGILPYLDFISRQNEFRYNAKIYIVKGDRADSLVQKTNTAKMFVGDRISSIEENAALTSLSSRVTLNEALLIFDNKQLETFIPYIEIVNTMTSEEKQDIYDILLQGYAIFRSDKLFYYTSREEARAINFIMNRMGTALIITKSKAGEQISMEIIDSKVKVSPKIEGDELHCTIDVSFTTNIGEIMGSTPVLNPDSLKYLAEQQEKAVKKEIEDAIRRAQERKSDHFSTITKFIIKYPMLRDYFNKNWKELFTGIKFEVKVKSNIKGTYLLNEPNGTAKKVEGE